MWGDRLTEHCNVLEVRDAFAGGPIELSQVTSALLRCARAIADDFAPSLPFWVVFPGIVRPFADRGRLEHQDYAKGPVGWITSGKNGAA